MQRVMTCLTVTPNVVAEAVEAKVDLIVTHHPMPFHAIKRLTPDTPTGQMLLDLIAARVAVYSAHTAFDSAANGINQRLARGLDPRAVSLSRRLLGALCHQDCFGHSAVSLQVTSPVAQHTAVLEVHGLFSSVTGLGA